jgi:hypothetical protein
VRDEAAVAVSDAPVSNTIDSDAGVVQVTERTARTSYSSAAVVSGPGAVADLQKMGVAQRSVAMVGCCNSKHPLRTP